MPSEERVAVAAPLPLTFGEQMVAGAIARGVSQTLLHPIDVVRTRMQARDITHSWGARVFAKGLAPQALLALPAGAVQFASFETAKDVFSKVLPGDGFREVRILLAGAVGATCAAIVRVPQELLKQRVQADVYPSAVSALRQTLSRDGVMGLYRGWGATLSRDVPWNALSFMFHGIGKQVFAHITGRDPRNDENLALAGCAGATAALLTMPIDVIKTRLMTQAAGAPARYTSIVGTLQTIIREEGAKTLMKGLLPRIAFLAPLAGVTFSVYEGVAKVIRERKVTKSASSEFTASKITVAHSPLVFASAPVRRAAPTRSRVGMVASEADALLYLSAYELPRMPYFVCTI